MDALEVEHLSEHLLSWADDQLVLGHRLSEWCGHAPILEEDIAFAKPGPGRNWARLFMVCSACRATKPGYGYLPG